MIKEEYEYLLKSYKKLNTRYEKTIKQSDVQHNKINKENELTKDNIHKLKSHMITKISDTANKSSQIKQEFAKEIEDYKQTINEQYLKINSLSQKIKSLSSAIERLIVKDKKVSQTINSMKKDVIKVDDILKKEISLSNTYGFSFTLIKLQIEDIKKVKEKLEKNDHYGTLIENIKKSIVQSCKNYDFVTYDGDGKFYIIYHHVENNDISSLATAITQKKKN